MSAELDLRRGDLHLVASLDVDDGEVLALLGPNGAGKTTALRALAGLIALDKGQISVDGDVLDRPSEDRFVPPDRRRVSMVFQDYLLFPHLDVLDNVAFGLRTSRLPKSDARSQAETWLERFGVADKGSARPSQLSGGQAQRVALARALAPSPRLLLLDEPLAALDAATRASVRRELRRHLNDFAGATVLVTHDPLDALTLASRVAILDGGKVIQVGPISELTARPRSRYVADLVGLNLLHGRAHGTTVTLAPNHIELTTADRAEGEVFVLIHPHAVALHTTHPGGSPRNQWRCRVEDLDLMGDRVRVRVEDPIALVAEVTASAVSELSLEEGQPIWVTVKATEVTVYPR